MSETQLGQIVPSHHSSDYTKGVQLSHYITIDAAAYNQTDPSGIRYIKDQDVIVENRKQLEHKRCFMRMVVNLRVAG